MTAALLVAGAAGGVAGAAAAGDVTFAWTGAEDLGVVGAAGRVCWPRDTAGDCAARAGVVWAIVSVTACGGAGSGMGSEAGLDSGSDLGSGVICSGF